MLNDVKHRSHSTRISFDSSSYDEICVYCGATDKIHSWGKLAEPCPKAKPKEDKKDDQVG